MRKIRIFVWAAMVRQLDPGLAYHSSHTFLYTPSVVRPNYDMNFILNVNFRWRKRRKCLTWSVGLAPHTAGHWSPAHTFGKWQKLGRPRRVRSSVSRETDENLYVVVDSIKFDRRVCRAVMAEVNVFLGVSFTVEKRTFYARFVCHTRWLSNTDGPTAWCRSLSNRVFVDENGRKNTTITVRWGGAWGVGAWISIGKQSSSEYIGPNSHENQRCWHFESF